MEKLSGKVLASKLNVILIFFIAQGILANGRILYSCSFRRDTCKMVNQPGSQAHWYRTFLSINNQEDYAMAVKGNDANNHFARMLTPYFSTQGASNGCLQFRYFIDGRTPASLAVIKHGSVTQYVFTTARRTRDHWEKAEIDVQFLGDDVLFYFEADTKVQDYGHSMVAFTDLKITSLPCNSRRSVSRSRTKVEDFQG